MKIMALDLGDQWTGTALTDASRMFARPNQTIKTYELTSWLTSFFTLEKIDTIIVGYPKTMRGTHSKQTETIIAMKEALEKTFPQQQWILWDERLTSKHASTLHNSKNDKQKIHSIAAALILESYLMHLQMKSMLEQE